MLLSLMQVDGEDVPRTQGTYSLVDVLDGRGVSTERRLPDVMAELSVYVYGPLIVTSLFLQKFALPGTANSISVGTLVMPVVVGIAWLKRYVAIDPASFFAIGLFISLACFSPLSHPEHGFSLASLALVVCSQLPLTTRRQDQSASNDRALQFYSSVMVVLCVLGIAQFASQWVVPQQVSFFLDYNIPALLRIDTYNNLNPLEYGADKLKSNGVFFAEPSFFSQSAALAAIIELSTRKRALRIFIFLAGVFVSYSGTGMMMLAPFGLYFLAKGRSLVPIIACVGIAFIVVAFGSVLRLDAIVDRLDEFLVPGSSGYARFVSIFDIMRDYQIPELQTTLFGTGAGQVTPFLALLPYEGFGPTWGKLFFEYGVLGCIAYGTFLWLLIGRAESALRFPLLFTYLFLGGYLGDAAVLIPMLLFVCWAPRRSPEDAVISGRLPAGQIGWMPSAFVEGGVALWGTSN